MKKQILAMLLGAFSAQAMAVDVDGNVGLVSEYVWRGIPSSDGKAAAQGGVDAGWDNGIYAGTWVSTADYDGISGIEVDLYGGWGGETGDFSYAVGGTYYTFTDSIGVDLTELNLSGGWKWFTLDIAIGRAENDSATATPKKDYQYYALTGEWNGLYATAGTWRDELFDKKNPAYLELGYGNTLSINGSDLFDYKFSYIYSEDELLLQDPVNNQPNNTLVFGIVRNFGIYNP